MDCLGLFAYGRRKFFVTIFRSFIFVRNLILFARQDRVALQSIRRQRIHIPSRTARRSITADLYSPPGSRSNTAEPRPVLVNWHGSGFIIPLLGTDYLFCDRVARDLGVFVIDADYRKSPEYLFPGALEDVEDVLKWVASQSHRFDVSRVAVSGFSAGGTLALVAASALRRETPELTIPAVVAFYPITNMTLAPEARDVPHPQKPLPPFLMELFFDSYAPDKTMRADPRVSPAMADPADYPSTVVMLTADGDTLSPEGDALAMTLDDGTRTVVHRSFKGARHGFDSRRAEEGSMAGQQREEAYTLATNALKEAFAL
ncbi:alpha/beta-hydrolase [Xylariaceae sp. FL0016]|nr:alpha/beta-hydrolase [Xylariaceae sp. FL0016]